MFEQPMLLVSTNLDFINLIPFVCSFVVFFPDDKDV